MRADRLLSLLMLLQIHGKLPASRLARELGVTVRTVYRDIQALSAAGVPVYAERGPGGGCALVDSYRTTLTGLTESEARAIFLLNVPDIMADLGIGNELRSALRKLQAALPPRQREEEARLSGRLYLDATAWFQEPQATPHLETLQAAVEKERWLTIAYALDLFGAQMERRVAAYGLVAKAGIWYLVASWEGQVRAYRAARITAARLESESFQRPADFNLAQFWNEWRKEFERNRPEFCVQVRAAPEILPRLQRLQRNLPGGTLAPGTPDIQGWYTLELVFESFPAAREQILGMGRAVEVLGPPALRLSVMDFASQIVAFYSRGR